MFFRYPFSQTGRQKQILIGQVGSVVLALQHYGLIRFYLFPLSRGFLGQAPSKADSQNSNKHLGFCFTVFSRTASDAAQEQKITPHQKRELNTILQLVDEAESMFTTRQRSICKCGRLLHESWQVKRTLTQKITNSNIDEIYERWAEFWRLEGKQQWAGRQRICAVRGTAGPASGAQG
jgi:hypothetical protein